MTYQLKFLGENQPSYTIKQMTILFGIKRSELSKWVKEGRFKGVGPIQGKLTGIKDDTVFLSEMGEEVTVGKLVKEYIEKQ